MTKSPALKRGLLTLEETSTLLTGPIRPRARAGSQSYAPGESSAEYRIVKGIDAPVALAFDDGGNLYVANILDEGWTSVYAPGGAKEPLRENK